MTTLSKNLVLENFKTAGNFNAGFGIVDFEKVFRGK